MDELSPNRIQQHNQQQQTYFESTLKRTMIPEATPYIHRQIEQMIRYGELSPDQRILEVGCGMGRYTLLLLERGFSIDGLDLSPVLLDRLRSYDAGRYSPHLYSADILDHPAELDGKYDAVVGFFTLHHLHDLTASFQAMNHLLIPGGRILFLEPNAYNPLYYLQILLSPGMTWAGDGGVARMRAPVVFRAMQNSGFKDLAVHRFGFFPPHLTNLAFGPGLENALQRLFAWTRMLPFQIFSGIRA